MNNARVAIELWLETVIDDGGSVPEPRPIDAFLREEDYRGWIWAVAEVDLSS